MTDGGQRFLKELNKALGNLSNKKDILADYELHVYEIKQENPESAETLYEDLIARIGHPQEIAKIWKAEAKITPKRTQRLFVILNILLFAGGSILTFSYNVFGWDWIRMIWSNLTNISFIIMSLYILFWALLGYEIGKEFGHKGRKLLRKTFIYCIIPNLVLMYLIVFHFIPHEWFQPLLSGPFIAACIGLTVLLYPISWISYIWGRKTSI